jgi:hypothetical protein
MFCRLFDIDETTLEEYALGLSPEFRLNVCWLPGARFNGEPGFEATGEPVFEPNAEPRTRQLITHFLKNWPGVVAVNVGRVTSAQTARDRSGEQREVFLIVLEDGSGNTSIRLVRLIKWDVRHSRLQHLARTGDRRFRVSELHFRFACDLALGWPSRPSQIRLRRRLPAPRSARFFHRGTCRARHRQAPSRTLRAPGIPAAAHAASRRGSG